MQQEIKILSKQDVQQNENFHLIVVCVCCWLPQHKHMHTGMLEILFLQRNINELTVRNKSANTHQEVYVRLKQIFCLRKLHKQRVL